MEIPHITDRTPVAWIGTGVMGASMCTHLLEAGHPIHVFTRTRERATDLCAKGAIFAASAADAAARADVVITMVGFPRDVEEVYRGTRGVLEGARSGALLIDMTTTRPSLARELDAAARAKGALFLDAPVSGGDVGARNATLSIMVGGSEPAFRAAGPIFARLGGKVVLQGPAGAGQNTKMCNQIAIAGTMIGVCESLLYGARAGLDLASVLESIGGGAAACWSLANLAPRILARDFEPGFFVEHFVKDMEIALEEAQRLELTLPGLALARDLYRALARQGGGRRGTQALYLALEELNDRSLEA